MAGSVSFGGLASGLDTNALIQNLVALQRRPIQQLETRQNDYRSNISSFSTIKTKFSELQDIIEEMSSTESFQTLSASTSDSDILTASATGDASPGTLSIDVQQLATYQKNHGYTFGSQTDPATGTGTLRIQVGTGGWNDINISNTDSLVDIKEAINDADVGATASIIYDGSDYRLSITGDNSGLDNAVSFDETGGVVLGFEDPASLITTADNAEIIVDGVINASSSDNIFDDLMVGLTINLKKADPGTPVTVSVNQDHSAQVDKLQKFVDAYNSVINTVNSFYQPKEIGKTGGLIMDTGLRNMKADMNSLVSQSMGSGTFTSLSHIGIKTEPNGTLSLDTDKLEDALNTDFESVTTLFTDETEGVGTRFDSYVEELTKLGGVLDLRKNGAEEEISRLDTKIESLQANSDRYEEMLVKKFAAMEQLVSSMQTQGNQMMAQLSSLNNK